MSSKKLVYVKGVVYRAYRSRALLDFFYETNKYAAHFLDQRYLVPSEATRTRHILFKVIRGVDKIYNTIKLCLADVVYLLPMGRLNPLEVLCVRLFRIKVVGEFYVSRYDTYVNDRKTMARESKEAQAELLKDQHLIDISNHVVFLNASERTYYLRIIGREEKDVASSVIPLVTNRKKRALIPYVHENEATMVLCWWGTFIPLHGLDKIVRAASILHEKNLDFKLYLFGTSDEKSKPYQKMIDDSGLGEYIFIDNSKRFADQSLTDFLAQYCDIAFGNFGDSEKARTVMVNKVVEAASMGLPVISQRTSALEEFFMDGESIFFSESTPEKIAEKVIQLSKDKPGLGKVAQSGSDVFESHFTKEAYLKGVVSILEDVLSEN